MKQGFGILVLGLVVGNYTLAKTLVDDGVIRDIYSLESLFWERQCQFLPVSPPSEEIYVHSDSTVVAVDWAKFPPEFTKEMYAQMDENGYPIYRVLIYEELSTRETVFLNSYGTEVYRLSPAEDYDPYAWQKETFQISDVSELSEWTRWIFDPAHIAAEISLIPETFHEDYLATQEALAAQEAMMMPMMLSLPATVTNLVMGIDIGTNGAMEVEIGWPSSFTNFLEIFASTNLVEHQWQLVCTNITTTSRRDASDWSVLSAFDHSDLTTDRGFNGHEQLDHLDLIHMNDRIYDPVIGRMLSPDSAIMEPGNLQSFNRYSYVMNNPLTLSVDSGFTKSGLENLLISAWNSGGQGRSRRESPLLDEPITNDPLSEQDKLNTLSSSRDSKAEKLTWTDWEWVADEYGGVSYQSSEITTYATSTKVEAMGQEDPTQRSFAVSDDVADYGINTGSYGAVMLGNGSATGANADHVELGNGDYVTAGVDGSSRNINAAAKASQGEAGEKNPKFANGISVETFSGPNAINNAAITACDYIFGETVEKDNDIEMGGFIVKVGEDAYAYTKPIEGTEHEVKMGRPPANAVAWYHSHGKDSPGYDDYNFSGVRDQPLQGGDKGYSELHKLHAYLITPDKGIKKYDYIYNDDSITIRKGKR